MAAKADWQQGSIGSKTALAARQHWQQGSIGSKAALAPVAATNEMK